MENTVNSQVNVTVSGNDSLAVRTVTAVVRDSLGNAGFSNVSAFSVEAAHDARSLDSGSLLDRVRAERPQLLDSRVAIQYLDNEPTEFPPLIDPRDDLLADAPSSSLAPEGDTVDPVVAEEVVREMAHAVTGNVGAVDGDPVAADEESA